MKIIIGLLAKTLILILLLKFASTQDTRFSPLSIPQKVSISAVMSSTSFQISLDYFIESDQTADTLFCFRKMEIIQDQQSKTCSFDLSNPTALLYAIFKCYRMQHSTTESSWKASQNDATFQFEDLFSIENKKDIKIQSLTFVQNISIAQSNSLKKIPLNNFFNLYSIYQLRTCSEYNQTTNLCGQLRTNYVHTYFHQNMVDNLIMQRNYNCFTHHQITNRYVFLFSGGVIRQNDWYYFIAVLITQTTGVINMWGGISYSQSHTLSDMFGFESKTGKSYDLYSLYASAPFQDIDPNINSTYDVTIMANSYDAIYSNETNYYIQYYRLYDTKDGKADDKLRDKIQINYCFVGFFDQNNTKNIYSPLDKKFKHSIKQCWKPNLLLKSTYLNVLSSFLLAIMILFIF